MKEKLKQKKSNKRPRISESMKNEQNSLNIIFQDEGGGARGVIVIVVGNEHGNTSSNPGRDWLHFT